MAEFKFNSSVRTIDLSAEDTDEKLTLSVDVGNKDLMQKWISELNGLEKFADAKADDKNVLDQLEDAERKVLAPILGVDAFDKIMVVCNNNLFSVISFIKYLTGFLNKELEGFFKDYV